MLRNALEIVPELFELRVRHDGGGSATVLISDLRRARAPSQTHRERLVDISGAGGQLLL